MQNGVRIFFPEENTFNTTYHLYLTYQVFLLNHSYHSDLIYIVESEA